LTGRSRSTFSVLPDAISEIAGPIVTPVAAVRARGLVKRFETTVAVTGVDLVVEDGAPRR
jgi:hypothetical protein